MRIDFSFAEIRRINSPAINSSQVFILFTFYIIRLESKQTPGELKSPTRMKQINGI